MILLPDLLHNPGNSRYCLAYLFDLFVRLSQCYQAYGRFSYEVDWKSCKLFRVLIKSMQPSKTVIYDQDIQGRPCAREMSINIPVQTKLTFMCVPGLFSVDLNEI